MTLLSLVTTALPDLIGMAIRWELGPRVLWTALEGATEYRAAIARGDVASDAEADGRTGKCAKCPALTWSKPRRLRRTRAGYCGPKFVPTVDTCGCLVVVTVKGQIQPGGKVSVGSEACPRGCW